MRTPPTIYSAFLIALILVSASPADAVRVIGDTTKPTTIHWDSAMHWDTAKKVLRYKTDTGYVTVATGKPLPEPSLWNIGEYMDRQSPEQRKETRNLLIKIGALALFVLYGLVKLIRRLF